jgi:hypothetical protein
MLSLLLLGGLSAGLLAAQGPPRTVIITLGARQVTFAGTEGLPSGPTRIEFRNPGGRPAVAVLAALRPGRTLGDLERALPSTERTLSKIKRVVTFEASGSVPAGGRYVTTIDLRAGATYAAANVEGRARFETFTVGAAAGGGTRPTPAAVVGLYDYAFGMPDTLPRRGTIRFENRGERVHIAAAVPLRRGANRTAAIRAIIRFDERRLRRLALLRRASEIVGVVSGGSVNDVEVDFGRRGNWVFLCFVEDGEPGSPPHNTIGMVRAFRVR